jgi:hypothetical protein
VTPQDNETSKTLVKQADVKQAELKKLGGAAFDKAYADNEVAYHKAVDNALETVLIPNAMQCRIEGSSHDRSEDISGSRTARGAGRPIAEIGDRDGWRSRLIGDSDSDGVDHACPGQ